jgi:hypothetical protein
MSQATEEVLRYRARLHDVEARPRRSLLPPRPLHQRVPSLSSRSARPEFRVHRGDKRPLRGLGASAGSLHHNRDSRFAPHAFQYELSTVGIAYSTSSVRQHEGNCRVERCISILKAQLRALGPSHTIAEFDASLRESPHRFAHHWIFGQTAYSTPGQQPYELLFGDLVNIRANLTHKPVPLPPRQTRESACLDLRLISAAGGRVRPRIGRALMHRLGL